MLFEKASGKDTVTEDTGDKTMDISAINPETGDKSAINNNSGNKKDNQTATNAEISDKTGDKMQMILDYIAKNGEVKTSDIMQAFGLKSSQSRYYLSTLVEQGRIEACGSNKNRTYKAK